jgi:CubicO group peptidase (beta-lactamase class C family)
MQGGCNCENAPSLRIDAHNTEFAAVMAPRPMMLVSVTKDWTSHTPEVELPAIKSNYALYGSEDKLAHAHFDARHGYNLDMRNAVYPWFAKWLSLSASEEFREPPYSREKAEDLLIFKESVPNHAIRDRETLVDRLIDSAKRRLDLCRPVTAEQLAENRRIFGVGLRLSVGASVLRASDISYKREGDFELNGIEGERGVVIGQRRGLQIPVWVFRPGHQSETSACALLVHGQGHAALAGKRDLILGLLEDSQTVYVIEPFGIGVARADDDLAKQRGTTRYFTTFNRTDDAERVYDILAAIAYCRWHGTDGKASGRVNVTGFGKAGPWIAIAGAVIGPTQEKDCKLRFVIDANRFETSSEQEYLDSLFIPGVLRAGGLPNALALIAPCALFLHNRGDLFDTSMVKAAFALEGVEVTIDSEACDDANLLAFMTRANTVHRAPANQRDNSYFPPPDSQGGWRKLDSPEEIHRIAGLDQKGLDQAFEMIQGSTKNGGLLVVRRGWLVYERYFGLGHREATPNLASCGKSFTSIAVGILVDERPDLFPDGLNQKVFTPRYFPPEAFPLTDPRKKGIRLGQLLVFSAGIRGNNPGYVHGREVVLDPAGPDGWYALVDETTLGLKDAEYRGKSYSTKTLWCDPGGGYSYATASIHLASIMLRHITDMELQEYVRRRLAEPMGWGRWGYAYKYAREVTHTPGGGGIALRATDMLRFGYLLLHEGCWGGRQLVPAEYIRHCGHKSPYNPHFPYSLQFTVNTDGNVSELPRDAFWKSGSGGHALYVVPSLDLVVWKLGGRDGQYSRNDTGLAPHPAVPRETADRKGWKEAIDKQTALRQTLELVVDAIRNE